MNSPDWTPIALQVKPIDGHEVLITTKPNRGLPAIVLCAIYCAPRRELPEFWCVGEEHFFSHQVTAWMPLPDPYTMPKEGKP
jgi:hypothetical protein